MKLAPVVQALLSRREIGFRIVHTGQHYDALMTDVFFKELGIPSEVHLEALRHPRCTNRPHHRTI
jgi:UDP-N-acetylglucosamine 2-epimerase (non-hydrolysing)